MAYSEKLKDPRWQKKRLEVLEADNFTCKCCGETTIELHVHHFIYNNKTGNPWDVDKCDLITLCKDCHYLYETNLPEVLDEILVVLQSATNGKYCMDSFYRRWIIEILIKHYPKKTLSNG